MGGWAIVQASSAELAPARSRFESAFSVAGVPPLRTEVRALGADLHAFVWEWSSARAGDQETVADIDIATSGDGALTVVVCGALTGAGKFGRTAASRAAQVAELYRAHGVAILPELNGSFSVAVVDGSARALTLYADRFASRPVWFAANGSLAAGNNAAAVAALRAAPPAIDPAGLWGLFATGRHPGRRGLYDGIHNLNAGEAVSLDAGRAPRHSSWHQLRYQADDRFSIPQWGEQIAGTLRQSAERLAAVTERPFLFLSGGLDSRLAAAALGGRTATLTLSSSENMNARVARRVAERTGAAHTNMMREPYWFLGTFEAAALSAGGNYSIKHAHFMNAVSAVRAREPRAVFLLGDLLENFNKHYFKHVPPEGFVPDRVPDRLPGLYSYGHKDPARLRRLFRPDVAARLESAWRAEFISLCERVAGVSDDARDRFDALFRWYNCGLCPTYMMLECITPLAASRNLMFDTDMHALYTRVPARVRGSERTHAWTLWHLDRRLALMPDANTWQAPIAPRSWKRAARKVRPFIGKARRGLMAWRQRRPSTRTEGSWPMMHVWFRTDARYRAFLEQTLLDTAALPPDLFDSAAVERTWREFLESDSADTYEIDMLMSFALLQRRLPAARLA